MVFRLSVDITVVWLVYILTGLDYTNLENVLLFLLSKATQSKPAKL